MHEITVGIIKPDGFKHRNEIFQIIEASGLKIKLHKQKKFNLKEVKNFYREHNGKPFYKELISYMTEGPVVILLIEGENAISRWREIMGSTDPKKATEGTIRKIFGTNIGHNAVHGSDGPFSAARETDSLFPDDV